MSIHFLRKHKNFLKTRFDAGSNDDRLTATYTVSRQRYIEPFDFAKGISSDEVTYRARSAIADAHIDFLSIRLLAQTFSTLNSQFSIPAARPSISSRIRGEARGLGNRRAGFPKGGDTPHRMSRAGLPEATCCFGGTSATL